MESETETLGDQILQEYIKGSSKDDILAKLNIDEYLYTSWQKINKQDLKKIDIMLEKRQLCKTLKIKMVPMIDSDYEHEEEESDDEDMHTYHHHPPNKGQFLKKEPKIVHQIAEQIHNAMEQKTLETEKLTQLNTLRLKKGELQEKINRMIDLESQKKIGKYDFDRAMSTLTEQMNSIVQKIIVLEN